MMGVRHLVRAGKYYLDRYGRPDIIHAFQGRWAGYAAYLLARELRLPYVITEHESYFEEGNIPASALPYLRKCYHAASRVFAVSRAMAQAMARVCDQKHIQIIPNMVNTDCFTCLTEPRPYAPFLFLSVARLAKIKRLDLLIKAFHLAFADEPHVRLRIVGEGNEYPLLVRTVRELSLQQQVDFCGALPHRQVKEEMQHAHCLVLCSDVETFGLVLIEAIACGLPVIATKCGGPEDIVTEEVGELVPCDNPHVLANAMHQMRLKYPRYTPAVLHDFAQQHYGEQVIAARLSEEYDKIVNGALPLSCRGEMDE